MRVLTTSQCEMLLADETVMDATVAILLDVIEPEPNEDAYEGDEYLKDN